MWLDLSKGIEITICDRVALQITSARGPHFQTPLKPFFLGWNPKCVAFEKKTGTFSAQSSHEIGGRSCDKIPIWLVVYFNHLEKWWSSSVRKDYLYNIMENFQFPGLETTNQWLLTIINHHLPSLPHTKPMFETTNHQPPPTNLWNQPAFFLVKSPFFPMDFWTNPAGRQALPPTLPQRLARHPLVGTQPGRPWRSNRNKTGGFHGEDHGKIMGCDRASISMYIYNIYIYNIYIIYI